MSEKIDKQDANKWHRWFGVETNNRAWTLSERTDLSSEENTEMLYTAYAAAFHWSGISTKQQKGQDELLLGRVHAKLKHGDLAMHYAQKALETISSREHAPWEIAFAHVVMADAAAASGNPQLHSDHYFKAQKLAEKLKDPQDKSIFFATFDLIPIPENK